MNRLGINFLLPLLLLALLLAACGTQPPEANESQQPEATGSEPQSAETTNEETQPTEAIEEEAPPDSANGEDPAPELSERSSFGGFSYSIAHPSGWMDFTDGTITLINELEEDQKNALLTEPPPVKGYGIDFDHRDMGFMGGLGLPEEPTLQDLFELNSGFFEWNDSLQPTETVVFGAPSLAVKAQEGENWTHTLMGFANEEVFLLSLTAPTEEALDTFLPTWEKMLQSIEPNA